MLNYLAVAFSLLVLSPNALARQDATSAALYYPLQLKNRWVFNLSTQGQQLKMTNQVAKLEKIDDQSLFRIDTSMNGNTIANEHLQHTNEGLFRYRYNGIEMNPPLPLLKQPVKLGEKWKTDVEMGGQKVVISCALADKTEEVQVPAGKYEAIKLDVETTVEGQAISSTYWFAKGVGIVKQGLNIAGQKADVELVSFDPANESASETD